MIRRIAAMVCLVAVFSIAALAVPTTVDVDWDVFGGTTPLVITFQNGDDSVGTVVTLGAEMYGTFHAEDADNNPYNYQVDNGLFELKAGVISGGGISFNVVRTDSKASSYGPAGQVINSEVWTVDGVAYLARRTATNYASASNPNYAFQSNDQYQAAGTSYGILHSIMTGDGDAVAVQAFGNGSGVLTDMSDYVGGTGFTFGEGLGCYENSDYVATGAGSYQLQAIAAHYMEGKGWVAPAGGVYLEQILFNDGVFVDDIDVTGN